MFFFFKQKTAYEIRISDWSSDVCSSDLVKSIAGYFQGTVKLPYKFSLTLGGRYQTESRAMHGSRDQLQLPDTLALPLFTFRDKKKNLDTFSPKRSAERRVGKE